MSRTVSLRADQIKEGDTIIGDTRHDAGEIQWVVLRNRTAPNGNRQLFSVYTLLEREGDDGPVLRFGADPDETFVVQINDIPDIDRFKANIPPRILEEES